MARKVQTLGPGPFFYFKSSASLFELHKIIKQNKCKDFSHLWLGPILVTLALDPESAKFVLMSKSDKGISKHSPPFPPAVKSLNSTSIAWINGDDWKRHRSLVTDAFNEKAYRRYFPKMLQVVDKAVHKLDEERVFQGVINFSTWASRLTLDVLGSSVFGYDFKMLDSEMPEYYLAYRRIIGFSPLLQLFPFLNNIPFFPATKDLNEAISTTRGFIKNIIQEKRIKPGDDIVSYLINSENSEDGKLTESEIIGDIFTYFLAGHETTATTIQYLLYELSQNPEIQETLYDEIIKKIGKGVPEFEDLDIPYLDCVMQENMRLHPAATILPSRIATEDINYNGTLIPKGSLIAVEYYTLHRNENYWEKPEVFDPNRFLPEYKQNRHKFAFIPFAAGPRQCVGMNFSLNQQRLFIIRLLQKFRVVPPNTGTSITYRRSALLGTIPTVLLSLEPRQ